MRTTLEIHDESRARLLEIAARRGQTGLSSLVNEAIDQYLDRHAQAADRRKSALGLEGVLSPNDVAELRRTSMATREVWRGGG